MIGAAELICEVRTRNGVFRDWTSVSVRYSIDQNYMRFFQLELAEVSPPGARAPTLLSSGGAGAQLMQRLIPGDRVSVFLAGQPVISDGYIKVRQAAYDANRHAVQVTGIAKSGDIGKVSVDVPKGQFRGYDLSSIANTILKPLGVGFKLVNPPPIALTPFGNVIVADGESIGEMLSRLARQRGCWLWLGHDGTVYGGNPEGTGGATLAEGVNILSAHSYIEDPAAELVYSRSQAAGGDRAWGRSTSEMSSKAEIPGGGQGKKIIALAEEPATQKELQARTDFEVQAILSDIHRDIIVHRGWLRPDAGALWEPGDSVTVRSPLIYPFGDGTQNLRVWGVTCSQNDDSGTTTAVELVNEATFSMQHPNAAQPSPYNQPAQPAVPEDYT